MIVYMLNRRNELQDELRIVWEWNPRFRGRRLWWVWQKITPAIIVNAWV